MILITVGITIYIGILVAVVIVVIVVIAVGICIAVGVRIGIGIAVYIRVFIIVIVIVIIIIAARRSKLPNGLGLQTAVFQSFHLSRYPVARTYLRINGCLFVNIYALIINLPLQRADNNRFTL